MRTLEKASCPKCGSDDWELQSAWGVAFGSLFAVGFFVWIPVLGWIAAPICLLISAIMFPVAILSMFAPTAAAQCKRCKKNFDIKRIKVAAPEVERAPVKTVHLFGRDINENYIKLYCAASIALCVIAVLFA